MAAHPTHDERIPLGIGTSPRIPAINVGAEEKQLEQQDAIQLDLIENHRKQRDINQAKQVVNGFFLARKPDTQQTKQRSYRFNPRHGISATDRNID
ncbi:Uncharacterised protein [Vibrio cholerae]|nr:Uncharacterised protein [Vibrio cholerae]CSI01373.1 Uncharacterised protein [Vibrio cholerae]